MDVTLSFVFICDNLKPNRKEPMNLPASIEAFLDEIRKDLEIYESSDVIACAKKVYQHLEKSSSDSSAHSERRFMVQGIIAQYSS